MSDPAATTTFDPLFDPIEGDPIFAAAEPYRGGRPTQEIIASLPEEGRQTLHNIRLGAKAKVEQANAALAEKEAELAAARARVAELQAKVTPAAPKGILGDLTAGSPMLRRVYGEEEGDAFEGVSSDVDDAPIRAELEKVDNDTLTDPVKLREVLANVVKGVMRQTRAAARSDLTTYARESVKPVVALRQTEAQRAAEQARAQREQSFLASHPGLDTDDAKNQLASVMDAMYPNAGGLTDEQLEASYLAWGKKHNAEALRRYIAPPVAEPATPEVTPAPAPPPVVRPRTGADVLADLRRSAQRNVAAGGFAADGRIPKIPKGLNDQQEMDWLRQHPETAAALRAANAAGDRAASAALRES